jgi:hypothetical protein
LEQVPAPFRLHDLHPPQLATLQHTPSVQKPLPHWLAEEQAMPRPVGLTQVVPLQTKPLAQSALPAQLVRQVDPLQTYAPQLCDAGWVHAPEPLQRDAGWNVEPVHDAPAPHVAVAAATWQPPEPLQAPVLPHGGAAAHCPAGAGLPAATSVHVPTLPARLHAAHVPQDAALQQTPSVQKLLLHSWAPPQVAPAAFFATQLPAAALVPVQ